MIYNILYKTLFGTKPSRIRFDEIDGLITGYDRSRYLVLFGAENYDAIYNKIRYLVSLKNGITYVFPYYYAKLKVDSFDSLTREKVLTLQNYIISQFLIKVTITTTIIHSSEKVCINQLGNNVKLFLKV